MLAFVNGASLCMGLIFSIGPQNSELIRAGLLQQQAYLLATIYIICDVLFIFLGVLGVAKLIALNAWLAVIISLCTMGILLYLAHNAFVRMKQLSKIKSEFPIKISTTSTVASQSMTIKKGLILSILNPLAILETMIIIGSAANQYTTPEKWYFAFGAMSASATWFYCVSFSAQHFSYLLTQPKQQKILEGAIGIILCCAACWFAYRTLLG